MARNAGIPWTSNNIFTLCCYYEVTGFFVDEMKPKSVPSLLIISNGYNRPH
jgi:hypothetical protein